MFSEIWQDMLLIALHEVEKCGQLEQSISIKSESIGVFKHSLPLNFHLILVALLFQGSKLDGAKSPELP